MVQAESIAHDEREELLAEVRALRHEVRTLLAGPKPGNLDASPE